MAYVVEVIPPVAGEVVFEVEEPDWGSACLRARRYRERGWRAAVSSATERPRWWHVWRVGDPLLPMDVRCRSADCALHMARRVSRLYDTVQPIGVGEG